jgi:hypothetical protein
LFAAAEALWSALAGAYPLTLTTSTEREQDIALARAALGELAFAAAWAAGKELSLNDATMVAVAHE